MITTQNLRAVKVFADLPEEQLEWFVGQLEEFWFDSGEVMFHEGEPANHMYIIFEGELQGRVGRPGGDLRFYLAGPGDVTGLLPFSRLQTFNGTGWAHGRLHLGRIHRNVFPEILQRMPTLTERLVTLM